jgi:hypothetical protein
VKTSSLAHTKALLTLYSVCRAQPRRQHLPMEALDRHNFTGRSPHHRCYPDQSRIQSCTRRHATPHAFQQTARKHGLQQLLRPTRPEHNFVQRSTLLSSCRARNRFCVWFPSRWPIRCPDYMRRVGGLHHDSHRTHEVAHRCRVALHATRRYMPIAHVGRHTQMARYNLSSTLKYRTRPKFPSDEPCGACDKHARRPGSHVEHTCSVAQLGYRDGRFPE